MKKIRLRTKTWVYIIVLLLLTVSVSATVTITDKGITTDESDLIIDFDDNYYRMDNATIGGENVTNVTINQWNLGYTHRGDDFFNNSPAFGITATNLLEWGLAYTWRGDRIFNESKASTIDNDMMLGWNASNVTLIRNSNGNSWAATGSNIQLAINNCNNGTGSWVELGNATYTVTDTVHIYTDVELDMQGATIIPDADGFNITKMYPRSCIRNGIINVSGITFTKACISLEGDGDTCNFIAYDAPSVEIHAMSLISTSQKGIGIHYHVPDGIGKRSVVVFSYVTNVFTKYFEYGILLENENTDTGQTNHLNSQTVDGYRDFDSNYSIYIDGTEDEGVAYAYTEIGGCIFDHVILQPYGNTEEAIHIEGHRNKFDNVQIWDWSGKKADGATYAINFTNVSKYCKVVGLLGVSSYVDNAPTEGGYSVNSIEYSRVLKISEIHSDLINATKYNNDVNAVSGVYWFYDSTGNPWFRIAGDVSGSPGLLSFSVASDGVCKITSSVKSASYNFEIGGDMWGTESIYSNISIKSVLHLVPLAAAPSNPSEGDIYYDAGNNTVCCWNGANWKGFWI